MSHYIKPSSIKSYLSGICSELEGVWPDVRTLRSSPVVVKTLAGCYKLRQTPPRRKCALTEQDLRLISESLASSSSHDDMLFLAVLFTGWHCLMRLGELVIPDNVDMRDFRKSIMRRSVKHPSSPRPHISFILPSHKADCFFKSSTVVLDERVSDLNPIPIFDRYLASRDALFPLLSELWLKSNGRPPTRSWFISRLKGFFPDDNVSGHSLRSGGATALVIAGTPLERVQAIGCWSSEAFLIYLRENPVLLQGNIVGHSAFDGTGTA